MRLLVVEDERLLADQIVRGLREASHTVDLVGDGPAAIEYMLAAATVRYDVVVLDVMLPGCDGFEVCARVRAEGVHVPILMLTARRSVQDRVRGLDEGADDYLTKPFAFSELLARVRALGRRDPGSRPGSLALGDLTLDPLTHHIARAGRQIELTAREYAILEILLRHPGQVFTRDQLLNGAWELGSVPASNIVDVLIYNLRRKVDGSSSRRLLHTVRGTGYVLRDDGEARQLTGQVQP